MIAAKILFPVAFICLAFFLLILSALKISQPEIINSQTNYSFSSSLPRKIYEASCSSLPKEEIPLYPGILPNHPLYFAKMIRDKAILSLTRNPQKKVNLFLQYADKRLTAGQVLIYQGEYDLGVSTITKAEKYLQKAGIYAFDNLNESQNQDIFTLITKKFLTHRNIIENLLISDLPENQRQVIHSLQNYSIALFEDKYLKYINIELCPESSPSAQVENN